jgi:exo-beta-1,3-glucanase (GH17 family)
MNLYPFFTYVEHPDIINLDYALGNSNPGVLDHNTGKMYYNLLDAQRDTAHSAMANLGQYAGVMLYTTESGWPSRGRIRHGGRRLLDTTDGGAASVANAQAYNNNLINRVLSGNTATPLRPDADMDVYILALFNENGKGAGPDYFEQNFGLFYPSKQKVDKFDFNGGGAPESWCVANATFGDERLQGALDWACGHGADCSAIQRGASCF